MKRLLTSTMLVASFGIALACGSAFAAERPASTATPSAGFVSLFNGRDLTGWKIPPGDNGHWKVLNGVIDYDARSEAPQGKKDLWTEKDYGDFVLRIDWRIKDTPGTYPMPEVLPDGTEKLGADGKPILTPRPNADSGILLRGTTKSQVNIWCWPIGSGEVYGYRTDKAMPPEVRAAVTPKMKADKPVTEWNTFEITLRGEQLTVVLNGKTVIENARLPGVPARGPIGLQHHGNFKDGKYDGASALVQFRNVSIKEL
jgi:hypothetical protein